MSQEPISTPQPVPEPQEHQPERVNYSIISMLVGDPRAIAYSPFVGLNDQMITLSDGSESPISEELKRYRDATAKLPQPLRLHAIASINPKKTQYAPLEIPFMDINGNCAVEVFMGADRFIFFEDPVIKKFFRMIKAPVESAFEDDPDQYIKSISAK